MADNLLYYGGNLDILRRYLKDETVDLVDLDVRLYTELRSLRERLVSRKDYYAKQHR
jgi:hypothetical protein